MRFRRNCKHCRDSIYLPVIYQIRVNKFYSKLIFRNFCSYETSFLILRCSILVLRHQNLSKKCFFIICCDSCTLISTKFNQDRTTYTCNKVKIVQVCHKICTFENFGRRLAFLNAIITVQNTLYL